MAFCDDDAWWEPSALAAAVSLLDGEPRLAVITGLVLVGDQARVDDICVEMANTPLGSGNDRSGYPVLGFMAGASVVRRTAMLEVGGFAERFLVGGEEELVALDLAARGWQLRYVPAVVVHHHPSRLRRPAERRRLILRNSLWTALLRYPPGMLGRHARKVVGEARQHRLAWPIAWETLDAAAWLFRGRTRLPMAVVKQIALLRAHQAESKV